MIWRGPMVQSALTQMMSDVLWAPLDVLVLDMPPGTGDAQLTIAQRVPLKGAVIVSTPQDIALIDVRKSIAMFRKTEVPILGHGGGHERLRLPRLRPCPSYFRGRRGASAPPKKLDPAVPGRAHSASRRASAKPRRRHPGDDRKSPDGPEAKAFLAVAEKVAASLKTADRPAPRIVIELGETLTL